MILELLNNASNEFYLNADNGGAINLYHNGNKKFETTSTGVFMSGIATATSFSGDGSSLTGIVTSIVAGTKCNLTN